MTLKTIIMFKAIKESMNIMRKQIGNFAKGIETTKKNEMESL
jgi:hypothetical protein